MGADYGGFLAANILSEDRAVTYRLLSRALRVHVNIAKEYIRTDEQIFNPSLYFKDALRVPSTAKREKAWGLTPPQRELVKNKEDAHMQSSPLRSSPVRQIEETVEESPSLSITLVKEEDLAELQSCYESILSVHVYSLASSPIKDLQILSNTSRGIPNAYASDDSFNFTNVCGTIVNTGVRRRTGQRSWQDLGSRVTKIPANPPKSDFKKAETDDLTNTSNSDGLSPKVLSGIGTSRSKRDTPPIRPEEQKALASNPSLLRRDSSNIFKSFAKAKPKLKREGTDSSIGTSGVDSGAPSEHEDEVMKNVSEDEEDAYIPPPLPSEGAFGASQKSRKEREAALIKMMDDEDLEDDPVTEPEPTDGTFRYTDVPLSQPLQEAITIVDGRRRGRRRILRKKTIKDEDGYLVTKEEPVWESFSEEEPDGINLKTSSTASNIDKVKRVPGKVGQGSIMSFFGKK